MTAFSGESAYTPAPCPAGGAMPKAWLHTDSSALHLNAWFTAELGVMPEIIQAIEEIDWL